MADREPVPLSRLKEFQPLNRLTDGQLVLLASRGDRRSYGPGQRVLEHGAVMARSIFLSPAGSNWKRWTAAHR